MHRKPRWVAANPVLTAQMARRVSRHRTSQPLRANNPGWVRRSPCADAAIARNDTTAGGGPKKRIGLRHPLRAVGASARQRCYSCEGCLRILYFLSKRPRCRRSVPLIRAAADTLPLVCSSRRAR